MQNRKATRKVPQIRASLGVKLIVIALLIIAVIFGLSAYQGGQSIRQNLRNDAQTALEQISSVLQSELDGDQAAATMVALSIASRSDIQQLTADSNRQGLADILTPLFGQLNDQYKVVHLNIINDQGLVILRVNEPNNFGDYVFYNFVVSNTLETRRPTSGLEVDISGLSMRGAAPMFRDGRLIGLVEVGIDYGQGFANLMKQKTGADFTIWFYKPSTERFGVQIGSAEVQAPNENFTYYAGTRTEGFKVSGADFERAFLNAERVFNIFFEQNRAETSLLFPMLGPDQTFFGVTEINIDYSERFQNEQRANIADLFSTLGLSLIGLVGVGVAINYLIVSPLVRITRFANEVASGGAVTELSLKTGDEFEEVSDALQKMGQSIQQKREDLQRQVEQRTAQLRASNEVARVANAILDPEELIATVVRLITENFGYYYAAIFLISEDGRWAELREATGAAGEALKARRHRLPIGGSSMVSSAITAREARIALDVGDAPVRFNNPLLPNTRSEIALPLIAADRVIGALDVQSIREADFMAEDIATLQSMASQVAIALENARLFREMNASLDELRQANREYTIGVWQDRLKVSTLEHTKRGHLFIEDGSEPQQIEVPLNLREQQIGQITLEIGQEWDSEDQAWLEALATQVAISLENSRLLEESQQSALRERLSASIIQKIWASRNIDTIIQTAVRELARSLDAAEVKIELKAD